MSNTTDQPDWFRQWFNGAYKTLYPHRHSTQAAQQVKTLISLGLVPDRAEVLDVACGSGRHMYQLKKLHCRVFGIDLSWSFLKDAKAQNLPVAQADMRFLPFAREQFHLVTCFFSSFGYFVSREDDLVALKEFNRLIKPGGYLFLDLHNRKHLVDNLVAEDVQSINGRRISQKRHLEGRLVIKNIVIQDDHGKEQCFQERLRLYSMQEISDITRTLAMNITHVFGNEEGADYNPSQSPRMGLLLQKLPCPCR